MSEDGDMIHDMQQAIKVLREQNEIMFEALKTLGYKLKGEHASKTGIDKLILLEELQKIVARAQLDITKVQ